MNIKITGVLSLLAIGLTSSVAFSHARLMPGGTLVPRSTSAGLKTGPCGGLARGNSPVVLTAGSDITVQWEETINHPGRYEFSFSPANDANFQLLLTVPDTQDNGNVPHRYSATLRVPNTPCEACTIQMIQVMTENPAMPSNYYSCADIKIVSNGGPTSSTTTTTLPENCP